MKCVNCNSQKTIPFLIEQCDCLDCGSNMVITYNLCEECNTLWKSVNNIPVTIFDLDAEGVSLEEFINVFKQKAMDLYSTMEEYIHKCLKCNAVCYEIENGLFECSSCGFEWEVTEHG